MFASREGMRATTIQTALPLPGMYLRWQHGSPIRADLAARRAPPSDGTVPSLTLAVITALAAWPETMALCADMAGCAAAFVIVVDSAERGIADGLARELRAHLPAVDPGRIQLIARPLDNDFAAQRNRAQAAAQTPWVLHLDSDERLSAAGKRALFGLIEEAEADRTPVIAFTRRNFVDGQLSALYPDLQYRLVRQSIAYTRAVHEYPVIPPGQSAFAHLGSGILHQLSGEHVARRERRYEAITQGAGRAHDTALLRQPFLRAADLPDQ